MQIENNLTLLTSILNRGHLILFPADGVWGVSCNAIDSKSVSNLVHQGSKAGRFIAEILVSDLEMLKKYSLNLHPRMETLLVYHERPIRVKCSSIPLIASGLNGYDSYFRIVKDKACRILINEVGHPIFTISFLEKDTSTQIPLKGIKTENFENLKFIARNQDTSEDPIVPLVKVSFDEEGFIEVLG